MVFTHSTQSWSQIAPVPSGAFQVAGALEYFPDRNSLVFLDGDWGVWEHSLSTGTWTQRASTVGGGFTPQLTGVGSYHNVAQYSSACRCVLLGGGGGGRSVVQVGLERGHYPNGGRTVQSVHSRRVTAPAPYSRPIRFLGGFLPGPRTGPGMTTIRLPTPSGRRVGMRRLRRRQRAASRMRLPSRSPTMAS